MLKVKKYTKRKKCCYDIYVNKMENREER